MTSESLFTSGQNAKIFLLSKTSEISVGSTKPPFQWVTGILFTEGGGGVKRYHDTSSS
jgi:hypothetical protein